MLLMASSNSWIIYFQCIDIMYCIYYYFIVKWPEDGSNTEKFCRIKKLFFVDYVTTMLLMNFHFIFLLPVYFQKVGQIVPKWNKYGTYTGQISVHFWLSLIWKSPGLVKFAANLIFFGAKSDIQYVSDLPLG